MEFLDLDMFSVFNSSQHVSLKTDIDKIGPDPKKQRLVEQTIPALTNINAETATAPAKTYKFKLDTFQQEAVDYIERGESVLVVQ